MTDKVNGGVQAGEFLTGNMDFFSIATLVPMAQTNVNTPVADLSGIQNLYTTWQPVTVINGAGVSVTYSTEADYQDAFNKQANLNALLRAFALRVNPVAISVSATTVSNPYTTTAFSGYLNGSVFGSDYTSSSTVTIVKVATEKTGYWNVSNEAESNELGYQLLTAINGVPVDDLASPVLSAAEFNTDANGTGTGTAERNTIAIRALVL
jgi:hypothetical protein